MGVPQSGLSFVHFGVASGMYGIFLVGVFGMR